MLHSAKSAWLFFNKQIGINRIRNMMKSGELPAAFIGNSWMTEEKHLLRWKNEQFLTNTKLTKKKKKPAPALSELNTEAGKNKFIINKNKEIFRCKKMKNLLKKKF